MTTKDLMPYVYTPQALAAELTEADEIFKYSWNEFRQVFIKEFKNKKAAYKYFEIGEKKND